jgi:hypothetical protein
MKIKVFASLVLTVLAICSLGCVSEKKPEIKVVHIKSDGTQAADMRFPDATMSIPGWATMENNKFLKLGSNTGWTINSGVFNESSEREKSFKKDVSEKGEPKKAEGWKFWELKEARDQKSFWSISAYKDNNYLVLTGRHPSENPEELKKLEESLIMILSTWKPIE